MPFRRELKFFSLPLQRTLFKAVAISKADDCLCTNSSSLTVCTQFLCGIQCLVLHVLLCPGIHLKGRAFFILAPCDVLGDHAPAWRRNWKLPVKEVIPNLMDWKFPVNTLHVINTTQKPRDSIHVMLNSFQLRYTLSYIRIRILLQPFQF